MDSAVKKVNFIAPELINYNMQLFTSFRIAGFIVLEVIISFGCSNQNATDSPFTVRENKQGIELLENDHPVFFYQREPKASTEKYFFNNYLHPLYDLKGDTLTEEFPEDHLHHRGIFWAWHQVYIDDKEIGDNWMMENISLDVVSANTKMDDKEAQLNVVVLWKSSGIQNGQHFLEERTSIVVHQQQSHSRKIDFEISLKALVPGVQLGGSADVKGYGGFCARIKLPKSLVFTSAQGSVTPMEGQVIAGAWLDFSSLDSTRKTESGMAILCHPGTPNYPAPWILRQTGSMQNIVFPGTSRIEISMEKPTVLRYRLVIHDGNANQADIAALQAEYELQ
ncbi:MAG: PmoA family protein [Cyclobacteriaceae bacterium]|nr:PmoA family protein [Cyclobacteriaceae bacterium]